MPAIEYGNRQHVQNREVHIKDDAEPQRQLPTSFGFKKPYINIPNPDWAAQVLQLYIRFGRGDGTNCLECARHAVVNLFNRVRVLDRHNPGAVPLNSDSWFHFTSSGQKRRLHSNVQSRATSLHLKNKLFVWMFADVLQQGDGMVDRCLIETMNGVA